MVSGTAEIWNQVIVTPPKFFLLIYFLCCFFPLLEYRLYKSCAFVSLVKHSILKSLNSDWYSLYSINSMWIYLRIYKWILLLLPFVHYSLMVSPSCVNDLWFSIFPWNSNLAKIRLTVFIHRFPLGLFPIIPFKIILSWKTLAIAGASYAEVWRGVSASTWPCCFKHPQAKINLCFASWAHVTPVSIVIAWCGSNQSPVAYRISTSSSLPH